MGYVEFKDECDDIPSFPVTCGRCGEENEVSFFDVRSQAVLNCESCGQEFQFVERDADDLDGFQDSEEPL